jgi:hypothetical protein
MEENISVSVPVIIWLELNQVSTLVQIIDKPTNTSR